MQKNRMGGRKNRIMKRFSSLLIMLCTAIVTLFSVFLSMPAEAFATESSSNFDGVYAIDVVTGVAAGTNKVAFFKIEYTDGQGKKRTQFVDAQSTSQAITVTTNTSKSSKKSSLSSMNFQTGSAGQRLASYHEDTYFFKLPVVNGTQLTIGELNEVSVIMQSKSNAPSWDCQRMAFYDVQSTPTEEMYGYYSNSTYYDYKKKLMGTLVTAVKNGTGTAKFQQTGMKNFVFHIVPETNALYNAKTQYKLSTVQQMADDSMGSHFVFKIDLADVYGAGIEGLASSPSTATTLSSGSIPECLYLSVLYTNAYNEARVVTMPVIGSVIGTATEKGTVSGSSRIADLAGQGTSLAFAGNLPDVQSINQVALTYGDQSSIQQYQTDDYGTLTSAQTTVLDTMRNDSINVEAISIYKGDDTSVSYRLENDSMLIPSVSGTPMLYFASSSGEGDTVAFNTALLLSTETGSLKEYTDGAVLSHEKDTTNKYLVTLSTDTVDLASTTSKINMTLSYTDTNGSERNTGTLDVCSLAKDFYGYWPGAYNSTSLTDEMAYYYGMSKGKELSFLITLDNVDSFTGVKFVNTGTDEWQMDGVTVTEVTYIGPRKSYWTSTVSNGVYSCNRYYERQINGKSTSVNEDDETKKSDDGTETVLSDGTETKSTNLLNVSKKTLIRGSETAEIDTTGEESQVQVSEDDGLLINQSTLLLSYEDTMKNYGFSKIRRTYLVDVTIPEDAVSLNGYGDSGSVNQFFFQLVFEEGNSGYVLSNQQLHGDGFRSGSTAQFYISTNEDFGDLKSINIISDNTASGSDVEDKLNIESIQVTEQSDDYTNPCWVIDKIGWLDIDYVDEGDASSGKVRENSQYVKSYKVTGTAQNVKLQISINNYAEYGQPASLASSGASVNTASGTTDTTTTTGTVTSTVNTGTTNTDVSTGTSNTTTTSGYGQFDGSITTATIAYYDGFGQPQEKDLSIMKGLYEYIGKTNNADKIVMDTKTMARAGTTDRFLVTLPNVSKIRYITMTAERGNTQTYYNIDSINIDIVSGSGAVYINDNNEYESNAPKEALAVSQTGGSPVSFDLANQSTDTKTINFDSKTVGDIDSSNLDKYESKDDKVNVYIEAKDGTTLSGALMSSIVYRTGASKKFQSMTPANMEISTNGVAIYRNLDASNFYTLLDMHVYGDDAALQSVKKATIQRTRNGIVIDAYDIAFNTENITTDDDTGMRMLSATEVTMQKNSTSMQEVTFQFGPDSSTYQLKQADQDIYVSLHYATKLDPNNPVQTKFVSLAGTTGGAIVKPNKMMSIDFNVIGDVESITGLTVYKIGSEKATIANVMVGDYATYTSDTTVGGVSTELQKWYSRFYETPVEVTTSRVLVDALIEGYTNENALNVVTMTINTAEPQENAESGITIPVNAEFKYMGYDDLEHTVTVKLNDYLVSGDFTAGSSAVMKMAFKNLKNFTSITLTPQPTDTASVYNWQIRNVSLDYTVNSDHISRTRALSTPITNDNPGLILLSNLTLGVKVNDKAVEDYGITSTDGTSVVQLAGTEDKTSLTFKYVLTGVTDSAYGDVLYEITDYVQTYSTTPQTAVTPKTSTGEDVVEFTHDADNSKTYKVKYYLKNDTSVSYTFYVIVDKKTTGE